MFEAALGIAKLAFEGLGALFGGGGITREELTEALDDVVARLKAIVAILFEESQWQEAHNLLEIALDDVEHYHDNSLDPVLTALEGSSQDAYFYSNNNVDLIDDSLVGRDLGPFIGKGLLGHPLFMVAAGIRHMAIQERMRFYADQEESSAAEGERQTLIRTLRQSIDSARDMQAEWLAWTERRFGPLKLRIRSPEFGVVKFRWLYWFAGHKHIAKDIYCHVFEDDSAKIIEGATQAVANRLDRIGLEIDKVRVEVVDPSEQVVLEWERFLLSLLGPKKSEVARASMRIEEAIKSAYRTYELPTEAFFSAHPEQGAERTKIVSEARPSLIGKHSSSRGAKTAKAARTAASRELARS